MDRPSNDVQPSDEDAESITAFIRIGGAEVEIRGGSEVVGKQLKQLVESLRPVITDTRPAAQLTAGINSNLSEAEAKVEVIDAEFVDSSSLVDYFNQVRGDGETSQQEAILIILSHFEASRRNEKADTTAILQAFEQLKRIPVHSPKNLSARLSELSEKGWIFYDKGAKSYGLTQRGKKIVGQLREGKHA